MSEPIAERAAAVVIDLGVREGQDVVGAQSRQRAVHLRRRGGESLELVVGREPHALRRGPAAESLADESTRPVAAGAESESQFASSR